MEKKNESKVGNLRERSLTLLTQNQPTTHQFSWSSGNKFVFGAGGLMFKSRACQIEHNVDNGSPPLRHFKKTCVGVLPGHSERRWARRTPYMLWRITASIIKEKNDHARSLQR